MAFPSRPTEQEYLTFIHDSASVAVTTAFDITRTPGKGRRNERRQERKKIKIKSLFPREAFHKCADSFLLLSPQKYIPSQFHAFVYLTLKYILEKLFLPKLWLEVIPT